MMRWAGVEINVTMSYARRQSSVYLVFCSGVIVARGFGREFHLKATGQRVETNGGIE